MLRSRVFLTSCLVAAFALTIYGLHRWPIRFVHRYRGSGSEFVRDADPVDRLLGTADYIAATLLFCVWPWVDWNPRSRISEEWRSLGRKVEGVIVTISLFCALLMGLVSRGAVLSLFT